MIIQSSSILLSSQHQASVHTEVKSSLNFWTGDRRPGDAMQAAADPERHHVRDKVTLSEHARHLEATQKSASTDSPDELTNDPRLQLLINLVERMMGVKIKIFSMNDVGSAPPPDMPDLPQAQTQAQTSPTPPQPSAGFGLEYDYHSIHAETEQTTFSAQGVIQTADGKEIKFNLSLEMSRSFSEEINVSVRLGDAARQKKDPLVINFNGNAAQLTDAKFAFDLNSDGTAEQISFLQSGSGFLALDKNADGTINNGSELFGPATGNGFQELASYDQDHNGFIDENDSVFNDLRILTKDSQGADLLASLVDKGIGAIYLGNTATPFDLKNSQNNLDGQIRSSGIYLNEDGSVGTVQQIDLAV
jgi:hypothetical protein